MTRRPLFPDRNGSIRAFLPADTMPRAGWRTRSGKAQRMMRDDQISMSPAGLSNWASRARRQSAADLHAKAVGDQRLRNRRQLLHFRRDALRPALGLGAVPNP